MCERRVGVEVDHGRRAAVGGFEHQRVDRDLALLQVPVRPHRLVADDVARRRVDVDRHRQPEHGPEALGPRAGRDHELLADRDPALVGLDGRDAVVGAELEARDLGVRVDLDALGEALVAQAGDRLEVEREAALVLVQAHGDALRAPVREEFLHVRVDLRLAEVEIGAVADPLMALVDGGEVALLHLRPERDVADAVVVVRLGVGLPDLDARLHQLAHRGLEVVVADDAAGDPRRARARGGLLEHDHVRAGA